MTTVFSGPAGVATYRAVAIKHGLKLYAATGMKPNSAWTPAAMLAAAGQITGQTFRRRQYAEAVAALEAWIQANGTSGGTSIREAACAIVSRIRALPQGGVDIDTYAPQVLAIMAGVPHDVWVELDERSGRYQWDDRFWMLRRVRNHETYGRQLFASLKRDGGER